MKLAKWQRNVLYVGLAGCLVALMFPPVTVPVTRTPVSYYGISRSYQTAPPQQTKTTEREWCFVLGMPSDGRVDIGVLLLEIGIISVGTALSVSAGASVARSAQRLGRTRTLAPLVAAFNRIAQHLGKADTRAGLWATMKRALMWWLPIWWGCTALAAVWGHFSEAAGMAVVGSVILSVAVVLVSLPFGLMRRKPSDATHAAGWGRAKQVAAAVVLILFAIGLSLAGPVTRWADDMERQMHPVAHHEEAADNDLAARIAEGQPMPTRLQRLLAEQQAQIDGLSEDAPELNPLAAKEPGQRAKPLKVLLAEQQAEIEAVGAQQLAQKARVRERMNLFSRGFLCGVYKAKAVGHGLIGIAASALGSDGLAWRSAERWQDNSREAETYE